MDERIKLGAEFIGKDLQGEVVRKIHENTGGTVMLEFASGLRAILARTANSRLDIIGRKIVSFFVRQEHEFQYLNLKLDSGMESEFLV